MLAGEINMNLSTTLYFSKAKNLFLEECQDVPIRAPQFQSGPDNVHPVQLKQFDGFSSGTIHKLRHIKS